MSIYTTPLQFAYFFGLLIAILLWIRAFKEERQSDALLGFVMFFLSMEIQDYTFGFAGINYLWEEMNGFPRYFSFAFAPTIYFYLKSQINKDFKLQGKHAIHYIPYIIYFLINIFYFIQGKAAVDNWQRSSLAGLLSKIEIIAIYISYLYYFYKSLQLYKHYRNWTFTEFSNTDSVSFEWLRNFIYLIVAGEIFKFSWSVADKIMGDLPYEQDWWWHLFTVCIIIYVGLKGYTQQQIKKILYNESTADRIELRPMTLNDGNTNNVLSQISAFEANAQTTNSVETPPALDQVNEVANSPSMPDKKTETQVDFSNLTSKIEMAFNDEKVFLDPELSLSELAQKLKTNSSLLSAAINQTYKKNFNDFVNEYRIKEYELQAVNPKNKHFTKLAVAQDCGFNSRATFHRAMKKFGTNVQED